MNDLQIVVLTVFTFGHLALSVYNYGVRHPAPTSRREQIAHIRQQERASRIR